MSIFPINNLVNTRYSTYNFPPRTCVWLQSSGLLYQLVDSLDHLGEVEYSLN